jgi:hypothetical protein
MNTCPRQYLSLSSVLGSCRKVEGDLYCDPLSFFVNGLWVRAGIIPVWKGVILYLFVLLHLMRLSSHDYPEHYCSHDKDSQHC